MQKPRKSLTDARNSITAEEIIEEVKKGDKTLTYYKRKSISPPLVEEYTCIRRGISPTIEEYPEDSENNNHDRIDSLRGSAVTYSHSNWRSEDNLLPTHGKTINKIKQNYEEERVSSSYVIDNQFQLEYLENKGNPDNTSLNSSRYSGCSFSKKYLDLSVGRFKQPATDSPPRVRNATSRSYHGESTITKYLPHVPSDYYVTQSPVCPSGMVSFPFDRTKSYDVQNVNNKMQQQYLSDISIEVTKRRGQICKYVAIFAMLVVAVIFALSGLLYYYVDFYPEIFHLNEGDVKLLSMSLVFCSEVTAMSLTNNLRIITFKKKSNDKHMKNVFSGNLEVYPSDVWYRDFYLQSGSSVSMNITSVYSVDVLIFVGEKNYLMWSRDKQSTSYWKIIACCAGTKEHKKLITFTTSFDERYYIVVHNKIEKIPVTVFVKILFDRISYDSTGITKQCLATHGEWCSIPSEFNSGEDVALEVPLSSVHSKIPQSSEVKCKCNARVWFYFVVFSLPFIFAVVCIICVYFVTIRSKRYCCIIIDYDEKFMSTEFLYHNKHNISMMVENTKHTEDVKLSKTAGSVRQTMSATVPRDFKQSSPIIVNGLDSPRPASQFPDQIPSTYGRAKYCSDASSQSISLDPEFLRRQEIMQLQELQVHQQKSRGTNKQQPYQFQIADGPRVKQLLNQSKSSNVSSERSVDQSYGHRYNYGYQPTSGAPSRYNYGYEKTSASTSVQGNPQHDVPHGVASIHSESHGVASIHSESDGVIQILSDGSDGESEPSPGLEEFSHNDDELYRFAETNPVRRKPSSVELFV